MVLDRQLLTVNAKLLQTPGIKFNPQERSLVGPITFLSYFPPTDLNVWLETRQGGLECNKDWPAEQPKSPQVLGCFELLH